MHKPLCVGILAHVDAGKTTLSEQILMHTGRIRTLGRVDHGNAFMDNDALERQRGITIFSEQASVSLSDDTRIVLIDTPGHEDFAAQRMRALLVMDVCILVVSCADRIQSGTKAIYQQVRAAGIPVLFFLNKTDQENAHPEETLIELRETLGAEILPADWESEAAREEIALLDEKLLECHLEGQATDNDYLTVLRRHLESGTVRVYCMGSALQDRGVTELLDILPKLFKARIAGSVSEPFSGIVYRVRRQSGQRLSYVRVLSGNASARQEVETVRGSEKIHALFEAQGQRLTGIDQCAAGDVAVLTGISAIPGEIIGKDARSADRPEAMMVQALTPVPPMTKQKLLEDLRSLEEEEPE
ncbi:MAG: GTP-binding protein, partial [Clostridia bacterium]|nr:GTP-binding protein [Clostridia bacterium]